MTPSKKKRRALSSLEDHTDVTRTPAPWDDDDEDESPPSVEPSPITQQTGAVTLDDGTLGIGTSLGEYRIEGIIGQGGMGVVYSAVHPLIGKRAAIKILKRELCTDPTNLERFMTEARVVNEIGHPNIVDIFAFGEMPDGRCYFVMEWLKGETLRGALARGRMTLEEVNAIIKPLTRALEAAHAKRIIHRDLKPDNVFLADLGDEQPKVKLLDFGIAKLGATTQRIEKTATGAMMGTPQYIAPEQAKGYAIDHRADIYALGGMLFEMLVGRPPFVADNAMEIVAKHLMETPPRPSAFGDVPVVLDDLVFSMLAKDPNARPTLVDVRRSLDIAKQQAGISEMSAVDIAPLPPGEWGRAASSSPVITSAPVMTPTPAPLSPTPMPLVPTPRASSPALRPPTKSKSVSSTQSVTAIRGGTHDFLDDDQPVSPARKGAPWLLLLLAAAAAAAGTFFLVDRLRDDGTTSPSAGSATEQPTPAPTPDPAGSAAVGSADVGVGSAEAGSGSSSGSADAPTPKVEAGSAAVKPPVGLDKPKPAVVRKGKLSVVVRGAAKATILVDNDVVATGTSLDRQLPFGDHVLEIRAPGMVTQKRTIEIGKSPNVVRVTLVPVKKATQDRPPLKRNDKTDKTDKPADPTDENGLIQPGSLPTKKDTKETK